MHGDNIISPQEFSHFRAELDRVDDHAPSKETFDTAQDGELVKSEFPRYILKLVEVKQHKLSDAMETQTRSDVSQAWRIPLA